MPTQAIKTSIETVVERDADFNMTQLLNAVWPGIEQLPRVAQTLSAINQAFGQKNYKKLAQAVLRAAFLIELVKVPKIETTKFRVRWCQQLNGDPRSCSFVECLEIASDLLEALPGWLRTQTHAEALRLAFKCNLLPYEVPLDYTLRAAPSGRIHQRGNLVWYCDELVIRTLKLRRYLTDASRSPDADFFKQVLKDKIRIKTYLILLCY